MATGRQQPPWQQPQAHPETSASLPPLKIYNSLTRSKVPFVPLDPNGRKVTWYACGPTVYDDAHLGHARNYVSTDILRRILRDYFKFDVLAGSSETPPIADVKGCLKIISRGRQQHLFTEFVVAHPAVNAEVISTVTTAYKAYLKKNLTLLDPDLPAKRYKDEVEKAYATVLNGGALVAGEKAGDNEAKVKMHIKTVSSAAKALVEASTSGTQILSESFYSSVQDVLLPYLDTLYGSTIPSEDYSIFTKLTKKYEDRFMQDVRDLNVLDPDEVTRVTEYVQEIVDFVEQIVKHKFGYVTSDGSIYFDITAFEASGNSYARLEPWNRNDADLLADGEGALAQKTSEKRSKGDFALWKASKPGEPAWPSPWGPGRPGWHIECSAMASAELGKQMDIHSGGIDLAFPHHDNELAQSEAYWHENCANDHWVNYFIHMGHLSIQGSKMSKSLKNFTTIREALSKGDWTPRSLRIIFLLGGWKDGIEITEDLIKAGSAWEEKVNNFFVKTKDLSPEEDSSDAPSDDVLAAALKSTEDAVYQSLCDSFHTPGAMYAISELISKFNSADKVSLNAKDSYAIAHWITSMVNIFGLNGTAGPDSAQIGWAGIDVPEAAKPYLYPLAAMRDSLRQAAKAKTAITGDMLESIVEKGTAAPTEASEEAQPYQQLLTEFSTKVSSLEQADNITKEILILCDRVRDIDLFDLGVYLEDRDNQPALVRPVTKELLLAREEKAARARQKQLEKEKKEREALEKAEKGKISNLDMFRTNEFSAWDEDGLPTKDAAGQEITKSRSKKLKKDWERQKKAHEAWLVSQK
ncbi:cysteine-tRNA ligase [Polytolypa hystricis UAMH7299]|uniref:cysteine--tRNA ligase n=1 Tax=Polytolypa hystricis (strain UAMH7299) TaxID=1447883 RepID=A0A2B7XLH9_POLH7|nr:cysteine-tRNA ligase [Polytolypa hystricis UAMH7299]